MSDKAKIDELKDTNIDDTLSPLEDLENSDLDAIIEDLLGSNNTDSDSVSDATGSRTDVYASSDSLSTTGDKPKKVVSTPLRSLDSYTQPLKKKRS